MITKILAGYYFVQTDSGLVTTRARGRLRLDEIKPIVGDRVLLELLTPDTGVVTEILPRRNHLERPLVANVDQMLVMGAAAEPAPNLGLIDRLLVTAEYLGLRAVVGINKADLAADATGSNLQQLYQDIGYPSFFFSLWAKDGLDALKQHLSEHVTVLAGQSGVGKSSLINVIAAEQVAETGAISQRGGAGRHTTRHVELLPMPAPVNGFIVDTPGFSRFQLPEGLPSTELSSLFPEMRKYGDCRFGGSCMHLQEPGCGVKSALEAGLIVESRYSSYQQLYQELWENERKY